MRYLKIFEDFNNEGILLDTKDTAYESTEYYSELDDIIKNWGKDYRLRRLTIYLRK